MVHNGASAGNFNTETDVGLERYFKQANDIGPVMIGQQL